MLLHTKEVIYIVTNELIPESVGAHFLCSREKSYCVVSVSHDNCWIQDSRQYLAKIRRVSNDQKPQNVIRIWITLLTLETKKSCSVGLSIDNSSIFASVLYLKKDEKVANFHRSLLVINRVVGMFSWCLQRKLMNTRCMNTHKKNRCLTMVNKSQCVREECCTILALEIEVRF